MKLTQVTGAASPSGAASGDLAGSYPSPTVKGASHEFAFLGTISPPQITADQNNYNPAGFSSASIIRLDADTDHIISGFAAGRDGEVKRFINVAASGAIISFTDLDSGSTAANQINSYQGTQTDLFPNQVLEFQYDIIDQKWRPLTQLDNFFGGFFTRGDASHVPQISINAKGLLEGASNVAIQIAESQVTNLATDLAAKQPNLQYKDEGTNIGTSGGASAVNFTGAGVTASFSAGTVTVNVPGSGSATITTQEEGSTLSSSVTTLNFTGPGTTASGAGSTTTIATPGAALTTGNDTNVTLAAGGSSSTALLTAASITPGWTGTLAIGRGGTGAGTATAGFNNLSPITTRGDLITRDATNNVRLGIGTASQFLGTDGVDPIWRTLSGDATLSSGAIALATVNSNVGTFGSATKASIVTVNGKGLVTAASESTVTPAVGSIMGLGANVATWLATPSSSNLAAAITDETGTAGALVFSSGPALTGVPTAPTASSGTNTTQLATTAFVIGTRLDQLAAPTASVSFNSQKLTNLLDPTAAQDAASKNYVDSVAQGLDAKASVRVATTSAGTLATSFANGQTVDGIVLSTGDRILIKNQSTASENGIYIVAASGAPTRATDMDAWTEIPGSYAFVEVGTTNADTAWVCTADQGGTLGTTSIPWSQWAGVGTFTAGTGLQLTGTQFSIDSTVVTLSGSQTLTNKTLTSPTLTTPVLGTPSSGTLTNCTGLPISTGVSGLGTGVATFLATPSSANLASALTDETGSGAAVFATSPTLVTPLLGTPTSGTLTNCTGLPISSGVSGLASGIATFLGTPSSANLASAITDETGTGALVFASSPALAGTPTAPTAANGTNTTQIATTAFVLATRHDQLAAPTASVSWNSQKITNLLDPASAQDAATKNYVDTVAQGLDAKASVRVATTANGTLASAFANGQTIDGITLATGDRILLKNQTTQADNGIYTVNASGAPTRATDMDAWTEVPGSYVFVEVGTANADTAWVCTSDQGGTLNTTSITWVQFAGAGTYTAGTGLQLSGTQFSIDSTVVTLTGSQTLTNKTLTSPTLTTPVLGTPSSGTLTSCTGLPISTGVSGLGTGVATFLGTPSSANLASAITDETGSGALVFATSPTLVTPLLGTPTSGTLTNCTGLPISTGVSGLGTGVATMLATFSSANIASACTDETGTGALTFATSPTFTTQITTPQVLGGTTPSAGIILKSTTDATLGNVQVIGSLVAGDNSTPGLFFDSSTDRLSVGLGSLVTPESIFHIDEAGGTNQSTILLETHNNTAGRDSVIELRRSGGTTRAGQTDTTNGMYLGTMLWAGRGGSATKQGAAFEAYATQNWTGSVQGTQLSCYTTIQGAGSIGERMRWTSGGNVEIGGGLYIGGFSEPTVNLQVSGQSILDPTTLATTALGTGIPYSQIQSFGTLTNLHTNPVASSSAFGTAFGANATRTRVTSGTLPFSDTTAVEVVVSPAASGQGITLQTYTCNASTTYSYKFVINSTATGVIRVQFVGSHSGAVNRDFQIDDTSGYREVAGTHTTDSSDTTFDIRVVTASSQTRTFRCSHITVVQSSIHPPLIAGHYGRGFAWTGTAHASTSTLVAGTHLLGSPPSGNSNFDVIARDGTQNFRKMTWDLPGAYENADGEFGLLIKGAHTTNQFLGMDSAIMMVQNTGNGTALRVSSNLTTNDSALVIDIPNATSAGAFQCYVPSDLTNFTGQFFGFADKSGATHFATYKTDLIHGNSGITLLKRNIFYGGGPYAKLATAAGTVTVTSGNSNLSGSGTSFTSFTAGDLIQIGSQYRLINNITNDTTATVTSNWTGNATASAFSRAAQQFAGGKIIVENNGSGTDRDHNESVAGFFNALYFDSNGRLRDMRGSAVNTLADPSSDTSGNVVMEHLTAIKTSSTNRNTTTTLTNDPDLTVSLAINKRYLLRGSIFFTANATPDFKFDWATFPTGATVNLVTTVKEDGANGLRLNKVFTTAGSGNTITTTTGLNYEIQVTGSVLMSSNSGSITFSWAQNASDSNNATVLAGSWLEAIPQN